MEDPRALEIIRLFSEGRNGAEVAKILGYNSHNSVNQYMRRRGYLWDPRLRNYRKADGDGEKPTTTGPGLFRAAGTAGAVSNVGDDRDNPARYGNSPPLAEEVEDQEAVRELLRRAPEILRLLRSVDTPASRLGIRPREKSRPEMTKSFRISVELDHRLERFCAEHGVMQKDVLETALWEFLESRAGGKG